MKKILNGILKIIVSGIISIVILSFVSFFYNYTGVSIRNESGATDYKWEKFQYVTSMTEGYAWFRMDKNGFNNVIVKEEIDILLMGSSHMEARQIQPEESTAYILNSLLDEYYSYNIGISGHTIYRLVDNIQNALKEYNPSKYVILETSIEKLDADMMKAVIEGRAQPIPAHGKGLIYYIQKIPAAKPIYNQLLLWAEKDISNFVDVTPQKLSQEEYKSILNEFLTIISESAKSAEVIPIIFFSPAEKLNNDGGLDYLVDESYLRIYESTCEELGIVFVDMTQSFKEMYIANKTLAHGFSNSAVGVGHLNKYGHQAIAETLADVIRQMEEK